jgi:hypothetical protein
MMSAIYAGISSVFGGIVRTILDLADDFNDGVIDAKFTSGVPILFNGSVNPAVTVEESGGLLKITTLLSTAGNNFNGLFADWTMDLTNKVVTFHLPSPQMSGTNRRAYIGFYLDANNYFLWFFDSITRYARSAVAGVITGGGVSGGSYFYFRLIHVAESNSLHWAISPDGVEWFYSRTIANPFASINAVKFLAIAGTTASTTGNLDFNVNALTVEEVAADVGTFTDNFDDNSIDAAKWELGYIPGSSQTDALVTVSETNQRLEITPRASHAVNHMFGLVSKAEYDFSGDRFVLIKLVEMNQSLSTTYRFRLSVFQDIRNFFAIEISGGNIFTTNAQNVTAGGGGSTAFDPLEMRYIRLKFNFASNQMQCHFSADGKTWDSLIATTRSSSIRRMKIAISGGTLGTSLASPQPVKVDNFTTDAPETSANVFQDDFNQVAIDTTKWTLDTLPGGGTTNPLITASISAGLLRISCPINEIGSGGMISANLYNLIGKNFQFNNRSNTTTGFSVRIGFRIDANNIFEFWHSSTTIRALSTINGVYLDSLLGSYDSGNHAFIRYRHDGANTLYLERATGINQAWVNLRTYDVTGIDFSAIRFYVYGTRTATSASVSTKDFDNIEIY